MIAKGSTVRVISEGIFAGQEVKVLKVDPKESHPRRTKDWYLLDTKHDNLSYQGWFTGEEIELVSEVKGGKEHDHGIQRNLT